MTQAPAVLLAVFNRPAHTAQAIDALLREQPARVYVSGDGPRPEVPDDVERVREVWDVVHRAPWQCEVLEHRLETNHGCGGAVRSGLDWFFGHELRGIIVEDDVALEPGALSLAGRLLDAGQDDPAVGSVTVFNTVPAARLAEPAASFRRSLYGASQGWGTWAHVWQGSPRTPVDWRAWLPRERLKELGGKDFMRRWEGILDADARSHALQLPVTWDFTWQAYLWSIRALSLVANRNHVRNTGFDDEATFSAQTPPWWPSTSEPWEPPFVTPSLARDVSADAWEGGHRYAISRMHSMRRALADQVPHVATAYRRARYGRSAG